MADEIQTPIVFISYSHDTPEHKRWVAELASRLRSKGVEAILDQWDLRLGDDVPKFMERSVRSSHRVLMICTETYVRKADEGLGGVGYESMIVTGELIQDLGTAKFIPVVKQTSDPPKLPAAVSTRFFINLGNEATFESELDRLLRELHKVPPPDKPPLGKNPFAVSPSGEELPARTSAPAPASTVAPPRTFSGPEEAYGLARATVLSGDVVEWRSIVRRARKSAEPLLESWWREYGAKQTRNTETLVEETRQGALAFAPLIAVSLAAVGSGRERFSNQVGLLEEILNPSSWSRSGYVVRVELPQAAAFLYQALYGATCLLTDQLEVAIRLVRAQVALPGFNEPIVVATAHPLMGWPQAFGQHSSEAWKVLVTLPDHWPWLEVIFGDRAIVACRLRPLASTDAPVRPRAQHETRPTDERRRRLIRRRAVRPRRGRYVLPPDFVLIGGRKEVSEPGIWPAHDASSSELR